MKKIKMNSLRPAMLTLAFLMIASLTFAQTREKRDVSNFHALSVSDAFVVEISVGNTESLEIEIEDEFKDDLVTEVRGGMLIIGLDDDDWSRKKRRMKNSAKAYLTVKSLDKIRISGAVSLRTLDILKSDRMSIELSGASVVNIELETDQLDLQASGASVINMEGSAKDQTVKMSGSCIYRAYDLESETALIRVSGASNARVYASEDLDVRASGASSIYYKGGASVKSDTSGASSIKKGK